VDNDDLNLMQTTMESQLMPSLSAQQPMPGHDVFEACMVDMSTLPKSNRRRKERIAVDRPAHVRGASQSGKRIEAQGAMLKDLSANGLLLQVKDSVAIGQRLFILFPLSVGMMGSPTMSITPTFAETSIAVIGVVRRIEGQAQDGCKVGVEIVRHRFLYKTHRGMTHPGAFQA